MTYSKIFAEHYDVLMGDYTRLITSTHKLINSFAPKKKDLSVLELACGTGTILKTFPKSYRLYGLDIAPGMVEIAKKKVPNAKIIVGDMTNFSFSAKFDVILCVFDSINHLTAFQQWKKVFYLAANHLSPNGIFIFDINTPKRLAAIADFPPYIKKLDKNTIAYEKLAAKKKNLFALHITVVENITADKPIVWEEIVEEAAFETQKIVEILQKHFIIKKMIDPFRKRVTKNTGRVFFVCKRRNTI